MGVGSGSGNGVGFPARLAAASVLAAAVGCGAGTASPATLAQMTPMAGNNDVALSAIIYGTSFRPIYEFDPVSGSASVEVDGFTAWLSPTPAPMGSSAPASPNVSFLTVVWEAGNMLGGVLPAGIAPGIYDLVVRDPRGQSSNLLRAFESLGPDLTAPVVTIPNPLRDSIVGAQARVSVVVQVDDGLGQVVSLLVNVRTATETVFPYDCSGAARARTACTFSFVAPTPAGDPTLPTLPTLPPPSPLFIDATAIDGGGNAGTAETMVTLVPAPVATSLSPPSGSTLGGTSVTILGENFLVGATNVRFDGLPGLDPGGQSAASLTVGTPTHVAGLVDVTVEIGGSQVTVPGGFLYVDPPIVRAISPSYGPPDGGTAVRVVGNNFKPDTLILFNGLALVSGTFVNANLIEGLTPPGVAPAELGTYDPVLDTITYGAAVFYYGADAGAPGVPDTGSLDGGVAIPYRPNDDDAAAARAHTGSEGGS